MMLIVPIIKVGKMITYKQLCEQQENYRSTLINRRKQLQDLINTFVKAIAENLGLQGKFYKDGINSDTLKSYVKILELETGEHQELHQYKIPVEFSQNGKPTASVGISVTLEKDERTYPKTNLYIRMQFTLNEQSLMISFLDFDDVMQIEVNLEDDNKWDYAVEAYKEMVLRSCTLPS